jgi:hypothetical protein
MSYFPMPAQIMTPPEDPDVLCWRQSCRQPVVQCEGCEHTGCPACEQWRDEIGHPGYGGCLCQTCFPSFEKIWPALSYRGGLVLFRNSAEAMAFMQAAAGPCSALWGGTWGIYHEDQVTAWSHGGKATENQARIA